MSCSTLYGDVVAAARAVPTSRAPLTGGVLAQNSVCVNISNSWRTEFMEPMSSDELPRTHGEVNMPIRSEVKQLVAQGPLPSERDAEEHDLDRRDAMMRAITPPVTAEEATVLMTCFGTDDAFGLAWSLLHLIETAVGGVPILVKPDPTANEWVRRLWDRSHR